MQIQIYQALLAEVNQKLDEHYRTVKRLAEEQSRNEIELTSTKRFLEATIARTAQANSGSDSSPGVYEGSESLADAAKAYLMSVHGEPRGCAAIANALIAGGFKTESKHFRSHVETALKRRAGSSISPDKELVKTKDGWAYRPTHTAVGHQ